MWLQPEGIIQRKKKSVLSSHHVVCTPPAAAVGDGEFLSMKPAPMADSLHLSLPLFCLKQPQKHYSSGQNCQQSPYKQAERTQTRTTDKNHIHLNYGSKQLNWIYTKYCPFYSII